LTSSAEMSARRELATGRRERRFAVAWRNRARHFAAPVAVLDHGQDGYHFRYLHRIADSVDQFRPFIGFPDLHRAYESPRLWPFFALRVMDPKRPDRPTYLGRLALGPDASRLDVLARSGGEQKGDSVSVVEEPEVAPDGTTDTIFLVRGARYAVQEHGTLHAAERLQVGDHLDLVDDVDNVANSDALLLTTTDGSPVGWIPDLLIDYARRVRAGNGDVTVVLNNGPDTPWHMRLLVRLGGQIEPTPGAFSGDEWPTRRRSNLHYSR